MARLAAFFTSISFDHPSAIIVPLPTGFLRLSNTAVYWRQPPLSLTHRHKHTAYRPAWDLARAGRWNRPTLELVCSSMVGLDLWLLPGFCTPSRVQDNERTTGLPQMIFINPALYFIQRLTNDELYLSISISSCQESTELLAEECIVQEIIWPSCRSFTKLSKQTSSWYWLQTFGPYAMKKKQNHTYTMTTLYTCILVN